MENPQRHVIEASGGGRVYVTGGAGRIVLGLASGENASGVYLTRDDARAIAQALLDVASAGDGTPSP